MTNKNKPLGSFSGEQRTSLGMSKLERVLQTSASKTNWNEMAKMLFWADPYEGRQEELRKLVPRELRSAIPESELASYDADQFQFILLLMLVISVAEKRTQEMYENKFSQRCDAISKEYQLKDDQYWTDEKIPEAWIVLTKEFEQETLKILVDTLREYHQDAIAESVQVNGPEQLFGIIRSVKSQFFKALSSSAHANEESNPSRLGSIPEMLQSSVFRRKRS